MKGYSQKDKPQLQISNSKPSIVKAFTINLVNTYLKCNPNYLSKADHSSESTYITEPHQGVDNEGYDNVNADYIFRKGQVVTNQKKKMEYKVLYLLGKGTFGQVLCCMNGKRERVALKVVKNKQNFQRQALIEAKMLKTINKHQSQKYNDNERIVKMMDVFLWRKHICFVFQVLERSVFDLLKQGNFQGFNLVWIRIWARSIVEALCRVHQIGMIHCDLKPQNIMFKKQKLEETLSLIDFGSCCLQNQVPYKYIQSRFYRAPQVILGLEYSTKIDMWSLGCILVELYVGLPLFPGNSSYDLLKKMISLLGIPQNDLLKSSTNSDKYFVLQNEKYRFKTQKQFFESTQIELPVSKDYYNLRSIKQLKKVKIIEEKDMLFHDSFLNLVEKLLTFDPKIRISSIEALNHPFLQETKLKQE